MNTYGGVDGVIYSAQKVGQLAFRLGAEREFVVVDRWNPEKPSRSTRSTMTAHCSSAVLAALANYSRHPL